MPTYIAFAADGNVDMFASDIKYYRLIQAWDKMKKRDFELINAHEKSSALMPGSNPDTIKRTLRERLKKSNRMLLIVGNTTKLDDDFVPYEIEYAADTCKIPIIVCYINYKDKILADPAIPTAAQLRHHLPKALKDRIDSKTVKTIHIPFRQRIIAKAMEDYNKNNQPTYSFGVYAESVYDEIYTDGKIK